jgi:hypothetical protein
MNRHTDTAPVFAHCPRRRHRLVARLRSARLDTQLARGYSPDDGGPRAARAAQLVSPQARRRLAAHWEDLLARAARPHRPGDPRVPLARERVLAVEPEIRALAARLRASAPLPARGVAMAQLLLTDGSGPLYARGTRAGLPDAIAVAARLLDPVTALADGPTALLAVGPAPGMLA